MSRFKFLPALMIAGLLAACAQDMSSGVTSTNPGSGSQMPQPINSLPVGASVNAPIAGGTGVVGETQVAPSRVRAARPVATSRAAARSRRPVRRVRKVVRRPRTVAPATAPATPGTTPQ